MPLLCCDCVKGFLDTALPIIQTIAAILACVLAVYIPKKISWEQMYSQLLSDYCGYDFGAAVMGVVFFFNQDCKCDVEKIPQKYADWFEKQFYNQKEKYRNKQTNHKFDNVKVKYKIPNDQNLHYQRRLLTQFYFLLDQCARSPFIGKRRVQKDFSSKEANLLKVLYYMNLAAESSDVFMDIGVDDRIPPNPKSINKYIKHIYGILKNANVGVS